jgi:hypothetical protein
MYKTILLYRRKDAYFDNYTRNDYNKHALYAGPLLNSFTHLRALLILYDCGSLAQATSVAGHTILPAEVTGTTAQVLRLQRYIHSSTCYHIKLLHQNIQSQHL